MAIKRPNYLMIVGGIVLLLFSECAIIPQDLNDIMGPTPTPHYTPLAGQAYVAPDDDLNSRVLWDSPRPPTWALERVPTGTQVEILESVWYYSPNRNGDIACYVYKVHVPTLQLEGWINQEGLVSHLEDPIPVECYCGRVLQLTPTPSYAPLSGTAYVNVGKGYGAAGSYDPDPREYIEGGFAHGVQVTILNALWVRYDANESFPAISCYMYFVAFPNAPTKKTWLLEDVLSVDLTTNPRPGCFPSMRPPGIVEISSALSSGYEIITPEVPPDR